MFLRNNEQTWQPMVARVGLYSSLVSYVVFWVAELWRPGMVSRSFSVHLFLVAVLLFGAWVISLKQDECKRGFVAFVVTLFLSVACLMLTWICGEGFAEYRLLAAFFAFFLPWLYWVLEALDG